MAVQEELAKSRRVLDKMEKQQGKKDGNGSGKTPRDGKRDHKDVQVWVRVSYIWCLVRYGFEQGGGAWPGMGIAQHRAASRSIAQHRAASRI
jgi:hypothetical protein